MLVDELFGEEVVILLVLDDFEPGALRIDPARLDLQVAQHDVELLPTPIVIIRNPVESRGAARDPAQVEIILGKQVLLLHQLIEDLLADGVVALLPLRQVLVGETAILRECGDTVVSGGEQPVTQRTIRHAPGELGQFVLQNEREAVDEIVG